MILVLCCSALCSDRTSHPRSFTITQRSTVFSDIPQDNFKRLKEAYPGRRLLIVSNTAGAASIDPSGRLACEVECSTGVSVLPHSTKKPGCGPEVMEYFRKYPETGVTRPEQVAVVGDRLTTDVMMANLMGGYAVWVKDGVVPPEESSIVSTICGWQDLLTKFFIVCTTGA